MIGTALRRSPLHRQHADLDAKLVAFAGWDMPVQFEGIKVEHSAVRSHAGMFDVSHMGEIEVEGHGALAFLQRVLSNDVAAIDDGGAHYALLCQEDGGVLDDLFVYRLGGDRFLLVVNAASHETDLEWLGDWSRGFDVAVRDVADRYAMLAVQGPHARAVLSRALAIGLPPRMRIAATRIGGQPGFACGTGYSGEDGVELLINPEIAPVVWTELLNAGIVPCGLGARDTLRLEVCFHLYGNDLTVDRNPVEAGLGWCCAEWTGFIGADAVSRAKREGTAERLVPFEVEEPGIPRAQNPVLKDGEQVGTVTSGTLSPSLGIGIGMAYIRTDLAVEGEALEIDIRGKKRTVRVAAKPLYRKGR